MSEQIIPGPLPEVLNSEAELIMPAGREQERAIYLRLQVRDENDKVSNIELVLNLDPAIRLRDELAGQCARIVELSTNSR